MESIIVACIPGVVTLVGVILSNSKSRAAFETKLDALTEKVEKHSQPISKSSSRADWLPPLAPDDSRRQFGCSASYVSDIGL